MFSFCAPKQRVDSPTFGHGAGMLIKPEIAQAAIEDADVRRGKSFKIFFSPQGKKLNQQLLKELYPKIAEAQHLMLVAPRYEGVDSRVETHYADEVISIGDYILMGGDLPAMVFLEAFSRLIPGVVGKESSVHEDSFTSYLVDYPEYTTPIEWKGMRVPDVVRSGDHKALALWRRSAALFKTVNKHFAWLRSFDIPVKERQEIAAYIPSHYAVLMHDQVLLKDGAIGTSSVTSIDIHDLARSSATYGLKGLYIVTPLRDQQAIVSTLMSFWHSDEGKEYNASRFRAMENVILKSSLEEVKADIALKEGKEALMLATCAKSYTHSRKITYNDQEEVWQHDRPVMFVFGTSHGLDPALVAQADYLLSPIYGFSAFNHLSVRSAAAIIFDRWLGLQISDSSRLA